MVITTPSGYQVTLKDFLPFGFKRQLEKMFYEHFKLKGEDFKKAAGDTNKDEIGASVDDISGSVLYDMQEKALEFLVEKVEIKQDGGASLILSKKDEIMQAVYSWKEEDGQAIMDKVNELTKLGGKEAEKKIEKPKS